MGNPAAANRPAIREPRHPNPMNPSRLRGATCLKESVMHRGGCTCLANCRRRKIRALDTIEIPHPVDAVSAVLLCRHVSSSGALHSLEPACPTFGQALAATHSAGVVSPSRPKYVDRPTCHKSHLHLH